MINHQFAQVKNLPRTGRKGLCALFLSVALLLGVGVVLVPAPLAAEAAATQSAPQAAPSSAAQPEEKKAEKSEQDEKNVYRHAPIVQSIAKLINLDVESTARLFEYLNFAILFFAVVIPLVKMTPRILRKRNETLRSSLDEARKMTAEAQQRLGAIEKQLAGLDSEVSSLRAQVEQESKKDEERIKASIEVERERIVSSASLEVQMAAAQAQRNLRHFAAELAIEKAAGDLRLTAENDAALIDEFLAGSAAKSLEGGQN